MKRFFGCHIATSFLSTLIGSVPGITIGSWFARSVPERFLRGLLAATLTGVAVKIIY